MSLLATIEALHAELDAHPDAHDTRLILADALEEAGDARAEGYRALGVNQNSPMPTDAPPKDHPELFGWFFGTDRHFHYGQRDADYSATILPGDWFELIDSSHVKTGELWKYHLTRREAEDAAALAFAKLPPERRAELLQTVTEGV